MPFQIGDVVRIRGGEGKVLGRICFIKGHGLYCVKWPTYCLENFEDDLEPAQGNAPQCSPQCSSGSC